MRFKNKILKLTTNFGKKFWNFIMLNIIQVYILLMLWLILLMRFFIFIKDIIQRKILKQNILLTYNWISFHLPTLKVSITNNNLKIILKNLIFKIKQFKMI